MSQLADPGSPLLEVDADLHDAHDALQALMALLRGCQPDQTVTAGSLRGLIRPIACSVESAQQTLALYCAP